MKIFLIILAVIALISFILLYIPTYVVFEFSREKKKNDFDIRIKYLFINIKMNTKKNPGKTPKKLKKKNKQNNKKYDKQNDSQKVKPEELPLSKKIEKGIEIYKYIEDDLAKILIYSSEHAVTLKEVKFLMDFGLNDAMNTGIATGGAYSVIYNILSLLNNLFSVEKCDIKINPDFEREHIDIYSKCILKVKNVHIMIIVFKVLKMYFKITKIK